MKFIIQTDCETLDTEANLAMKAIHDNRHECWLDGYKELTLKQVQESKELDREAIPVGSIEFVTTYLNRTHGFEKENPIEIPYYLRKDHFLKRNYKVISGHKIPDAGYYFIKDASTLKHFSHIGYLEYLNLEESFKPAPENGLDTSLRLNRNDTFVLSSVFDAVSEYRVYVVRENIEAVSHYDGSCDFYPDINLIKQAIGLISIYDKNLKSYTIDVMINKRNETSIIEIHNFTSIGIYTTLLHKSLLYGYRDGIDYLLKDNRKIKRDYIDDKE